jgi:hypothetical protein
MIRNLKALGLALVAVFAMTALAAQAAQAAEFHSEVASTVGTTAQDASAPNQVTKIFNNSNVLKAEIVCSVFKGEGEQSGTVASETTLRPEYKECTGTFGGATVTTNMCHYTLGSATTASKGHSSIVCPGTEKIEISSAGCVIKVGSQTATEGGVHYVTIGSGNKRQVTSEANVSSIEYTSNFTCQLAGIPASGSNSTYEGKTVTTGFEKKGGETTSYEEGSQVGVSYE